MKMIYCFLAVVCSNAFHIYGQVEFDDFSSFDGCMEIRPQYPGGVLAINRIIRDSARWNENSFTANSRDTVMVIFAVDTLGNPVRIRVYKSANKRMDAEAVRLVALLKAWEPGTVNGRKELMYLSQPFIFSAAYK